MKDYKAYSQSQLLAAKLAAEGAVLQFPGEDPINALVGAWTWMDDQHVFWFEAGGDSDFAGHVLEFDRTRMVQHQGVEFYQGSTLLAYLTSIAESELANEDELKATWRLWLDVLPSRQDFIDEVREQLTSDL